MHIGPGPTQSAAIKRLFCVNGNGQNQPRTGASAGRCPGCPTRPYGSHRVRMSRSAAHREETSDRIECKAFDRVVRRTA